MPTDTFFRLDEEKKEKIILAAKKEFSEVSIQEASVANIIKYADIPRGSFYQYFSDKDDIFFYVFSLVFLFKFHYFRCFCVEFTEACKPRCKPWVQQLVSYVTNL